MDNYFDFEQATIPPLDLTDDLSLINTNTTQVHAAVPGDALFLDDFASLDHELALPEVNFGSALEETDNDETLTLKLVNDKEVEAVRWQFWNGSDIPMFKAKTPCTLCARHGMDCFLATRGALVTGCTACINLYRNCSFVHPELPQGMIETFPGIAEDEQVCHGPVYQKKAAMASSTAADQRGRKSGARFHRDAVKILKSWLTEHSEHPYPNERQRDELKQLTGLKRSQINNWLANARRRGKIRAPSGPGSPVLGALDIPNPKTAVAYEDLGPLDRWKCSPPANEPASMTDIARAVATNNLPSGSLQASRTSSRKASSEDDSSNLSIMFQPPSISSFETRESTNSSFSLASSRSHNSRHSFASSAERRRRRRAPLLQRANQRSGTGTAAAKAAKQKQQGGKERIFQCTFCTDSFPSKFDWKRHEKALHLALERWTCCPLGSTRVDSTTGTKHCVFCTELGEPTEEHLERHNFSACHDKTVAERTFYRKDHLRQHLRLVHGTKYEPHMDLWKSTSFEVKSACGFCPSLFNTWDARADHLAAHFRNGADMSMWTGGWGFESFVERLVENSMPPYLIAHEKKSMNPFRAREKLPSTLDSGLNGGSIRGQSAGGLSVDQRTSDSNCWRRVEEELIKYVFECKARGHVPTDREMQDHARMIVYGDPDPLDWTMADNPIWLETFKCEHGLSPSPSGSDGSETSAYTSTRVVPVAAPYVIKGGLKKTASRTPSTDLGAKRMSTSSLPGVQERACAGLSLISTNSSFSTPITPVDNLLSYTGTPGSIDPMGMIPDFDAMDFNELDLNAFGEMELEAGMGSAPANLGFMASGAPLTGFETNFGHMGQHQKRSATPNPFASLDDAPEMTLEAFDQLTGYTGGFR